MWVEVLLLNVFAFLRHLHSNVCMCDRQSGQRQTEKQKYRETEIDKGRNRDKRQREAEKEQDLTHRNNSCEDNLEVPYK